MIDCRKQAFLWMVGERNTWLSGSVMGKEVGRQAEQIFPGLTKYVKEYKERNNIRVFENLKQAPENT